MATTMTASSTSIDINKTTRQNVCKALNTTLATLLDGYSQTKFAHWNVKGPQFFSLHTLFDDVASYYIEAIDDVAERITALGFEANGTVRQAEKASLLAEYPLDARRGEEHLKALSKQLAVLTAHLREQIDATDELGDAGTSDLYTGLSREFDKKLWFIEAHLQG